MKEIPLTKGKVSVVDDDDYEWLNQWKWYCSSEGYAVRKPTDGIVYMHRLITGATKGLEVDHRNMNRLDNRRENLYVVSKYANMLNTNIRADNTSGFKGVIFQKDRPRKKPYYAVIRVNKKRIYLGHFATAEEASTAYQTAVLLYHSPVIETGFKKEGGA